MTKPAAVTTDPNLLREEADRWLESAAREGLAFRPALKGFLAKASARLGASAAALRLTGDRRGDEIAWGKDARADGALAKVGVRRSSGRVWVSRQLDLDGRRIGMAAFAFAPSAEAPVAAIEAVCEELDDFVAAAQAAAVKQKLIERITRSMTRYVFGQGVDDAVGALKEIAPFERLALVYVDGERVGDGRLLYRVYEPGGVRSSDGRPHAALAAALQARGPRLLEQPKRLAALLGMKGADEARLAAGVAHPRWMGTILVSSGAKVSPLAHDLVRILGNAVSQRLVDYNRERRHLAQFFSPSVIDELLRERDYDRRLTPRVAEIGMLYADINSFTRICEHALVRPDRIGRFVNRWSAGAVEIVWKNGGVFDKMVGDCVIALFGPPFFREGARRRADAALRSAFEIQEFTRKLEREHGFAGVARRAGLPGLGVAIGVNVGRAAVGLFGPNQDLTAFSRSMNETARLQGQAGFREVLAMEAVKRAVAGARGWRFDGPREAKVKNVGRPLRYYKVDATSL